MTIQNPISTVTRPDFHPVHNGTKAPLQFAGAEYDARIAGLRGIMADTGVAAAVLTSMHNVSYYSGFTYCAFGRPYALVVTASEVVTISAGIDAGQPWRRSHGDAITYTDWTRDNFWRAVTHVAGTGGVVGFEGDHMTLDQHRKMLAFLSPVQVIDLAPATMRQRMHKSAAELELIRAGAAVADVGGYAIRDAVRAGTREIDVAMAGRDGVGDCPPLSRCRVPRHLGLVSVGPEHRRRT